MPYLLELKPKGAAWRAFKVGHDPALYASASDAEQVGRAFVLENAAGYGAFRVLDTESGETVLVPPPEWFAKVYKKKTELHDWTRELDAILAAPTFRASDWQAAKTCHTRAKLALAAIGRLLYEKIPGA